MTTATPMRDALHRQLTMEKTLGHPIRGTPVAEVRRRVADFLEVFDDEPGQQAIRGIRLSTADLGQVRALEPQALAGIKACIAFTHAEMTRDRFASDDAYRRVRVHWPELAAFARGG